MSGGQNKEHFSSILDLSLCGSGGGRWDRQENTHVVGEETLRVKPRSQRRVSRNPQQRARHRSGSHVTTPPPGVDFGRKRSGGDNVQLCVFLLHPALGCTSCTSDFPISNQVCAFRRYAHTCINTPADSTAQVYNLTNRKERKHWE